MKHTKELKAVIFDIQRFSVDDGPGIRTNIFFKGCPLRCLWCHNPESYTQKKQLSFINTACTACKSCVQACPKGVNQLVEINGNICIAVDYDLCDACGKCVDVCCYDARHILGREVTVEELKKEIEVDRSYFSVGEGGGVTLTGGEPLMQIEFVEKFLDSLDNIHVCMETSGYTSKENLERIWQKVDLFLFDYKVTDAKKHKRLCGVDNKKILENLNWLCSKKKDMILRLPLIPGVNDDEIHMQAIAQLLRENENIRYGEIMPYHNLGIGKAEQIGLNRDIVANDNTTLEQKEKWIEKIKSYGADRIR